MKAVLYILTVQCIIESSFKRTSTISQKERIKILRQKIQEEIISKTKASDLLYPLDTEDSSIEFLDYERNDLPITPILDLDDRKKDDKFKTHALTTLKFDNKNGAKQTTDKSQDGGIGKGNVSFSLLRSKKKSRGKKHRVKKPLEIFYRRMYNTEMFDRQLDWVHCQDIITPFLTGAKLNMSSPKVLHSKDPTVLRLISLLKVNTTAYSKEDIYSILYQISNLNLRFFRWDVSSMKMLFNIIIKEQRIGGYDSNLTLNRLKENQCCEEKRHTFGSLKSGLRALFNKWRLDFSNSTALLRQARIFRPPCVAVAISDGSTKSPKVTKYPKKTEPTTPCEDYDEDCRD